VVGFYCDSVIQETVKISTLKKSTLKRKNIEKQFDFERFRRGFAVLAVKYPESLPGSQ